MSYLKNIFVFFFILLFPYLCFSQQRTYSSFKEVVEPDDYTLYDEEAELTFFDAITAIYDGTYEVFKEYLETGANINEQDAQGSTFLHLALQLYRDDIVNLLLDNSADTNIPDKFGKTPIFYVKNPKILQKLIDNGADVNYKDIYGNTPISYMTDDGLIKILLKTYKAPRVDMITDPYILFSVYDSKTLASMIKRGANPKATNEDNWSPLTTYVFGFYRNKDDIKMATKSMKKLISNGADIELIVRNNDSEFDGWTLLQLASYLSNKEIVEVLVKAGADTTVKTNENLSILELANKELENYEKFMNNPNVYKDPLIYREEKKAIEDKINYIKTLKLK